MKEERILLMEKGTKGTVLFKEDPKQGQPTLIRNIYIERWNALSQCTAVKVTIESVE